MTAGAVMVVRYAKVLAVVVALLGAGSAGLADCQPPAACTVTLTGPASISAAASGLAAGDVLCLHGGVYHQQVVVGRGTVTSYPGEAAIIDGAGLGLGATAHLVDVTGPGTLAGVEVRNSSGRGVRLLGTGSSVTNVNVHDTRYEGIIIAGAANTIDGATVYNAALVNAAHTSSGGWPAAVSTWHSIGSRISGTTVRNSWGEGIDIDQSSDATIERSHVADTWSALVYLDGSSRISVTGNTLETTSATYDRGGQPAYGVLIGSESGAPVDRLTITNNTLRRTRGIYAWNVTPTNLIESGNS